MKRVLLTGGTGFIGRHATAALAARGYEVHLVTRGPAGSALPAGVSVHVGDLFEPTFQAQLVERVRPSHLLHLAWYTEHGKFWEAPENLRWVRTSLDLLENFACAGGERVVMAGTCAEYAWHGQELCVEDVTPRAPTTLYGSAKDGLQRVASAYSRRMGLSYAWGRLFHLYGPAEDPRRFVPSLMRALSRAEPALCTAGHQIRDLLHARDAAEAFVALLDSSAQGAVNIGSGEPLSLREVATKIANKLHEPGLLRLGALPTSPSDPAFLAPDIARLRAIGWRPAFSIDSGLDDVLERFRASTAPRAMP